MFLRIDDSDKGLLYNHVGDISYGRFAPQSGLGYQAKMGTTPRSPPTVVDVRHGNFTCTIIRRPRSPISPSRTPAVPSTRPSPEGAAQAYARKIGELCRDVFAAP